MESRALVNVVDNLTSESTVDALSANQGRVLKGLIDNVGGVNVVDNLTSTSTTSALSANQGKVLNDKINTKNIITVSLNSLTTQVNNSGTVPFNHTYTLIGDKLSLSNNRIVIGSGVTKVKISAHVWATSQSYVWFKILRNNTIIGSMIGNDNSGYNTLDMSNKCITVAEGNTIRMDYNNNGDTILNQGSGNGNETYITVEVVA